MTEKTKIKETEDEACNKEAEDAVGRLNKPKKQRFEKEDEDESMGEEGVRYKKKGKKKEDEDEEEEEETEKGEQGGENPKESTEIATSSVHTITPQAVTGVAQHVLVPSTNIQGARNATTQGNATESFSGKSVETDLTKSPLFVEIDNFRKAFDSKMSAVEKSVGDRLANLEKNLAKFYSNPMYKAVSENVSPEGTQALSIKKQIEDGKIRYS